MEAGKEGREGLSDSLALTRTWTFWSSSEVVRENAGKVRQGRRKGRREGGYAKH